MIEFRRSAGNLRRGVSVRFGGSRPHLVRSSTVHATVMFCGAQGYEAGAARGRVCDRCCAEARRVGYDV